MTPQAVQVVSALVLRRGRVLLTQRRADQDFAHTWESPGGKVESGEAPHAALRRELQEEVGLYNVLLQPVPFWRGCFAGPVTRPDRAHIELAFYEVAVFCGEPTPREGQGIGWFDLAEVDALRLAPANERARADVYERMRRSAAAG